VRAPARSASPAHTRDSTPNRAASGPTIATIRTSPECVRIAPRASTARMPHNLVRINTQHATYRSNQSTNQPINQSGRTITHSLKLQLQHQQTTTYKTTSSNTNKHQLPNHQTPTNINYSHARALRKLESGAHAPFLRVSWAVARPVAPFLSSHLHPWSVGRSVGRSVSRSVGRSVRAGRARTE
jgi:hypothetical protein